MASTAVYSVPPAGAASGRDCKRSIKALCVVPQRDSCNADTGTDPQSSPSPQTTVVLLQKLRELGVKIYLDDFGTGPSSLS
jgi:hypothetical protein